MKRRPKGMGSVTNLGQNRRKPFLATFSNECIGTYRSRIECEKALLHHAMNSYSLIPEYLNEELTIDYIDYIYNLQNNHLLPEAVQDFPNLKMTNEMFKHQLVVSGKFIESHQTIMQVPTFREIWEIERERIAPDRAKMWRYNCNTAFNHLRNIHDISITKIKVSDIQAIFDKEMDVKSGVSKLSLMKNVCIIVYKYAIRHELVEKDLSQYIIYHGTSDTKIERKPFTRDEIIRLQEDDTPASRIVLIYIYTGMRPIELFKLKKSDIHLDEKYMVGGVKSAAGKNRVIPIHDSIIQYLHDFINDTDPQLLFTDNKPDTAVKIYRKQYHDLMLKLDLNHENPYDTRHTFSTIAKLCHIDTAARKKIMGHACNDLTDDVYTHEPIAYLVAQINKINLLDYC